MSPLTDRQQTVLDVLLAYQAEQGLPPTLSELAAALGIQLNAARKHLQALADKGMIELVAGKARGIRLPQPGLRNPAGLRSDLLQLPLVGRVAAGAPILADSHIDGQFSIDAALFRPRPDYLLRVEGDSMIGVGIHAGDLIAVHRTPQAEHGQIVVARIEGEITVKRLQWTAAGIRLLSANPAYAPIEVPPDTADFAIEGLYVGSIRRG